MIVYDFNGVTECNDVFQFQEVLKHRSKFNSNDFEIRTDSEYPYLSILVKDEFACVHFFDEESICGFYAYTEKNSIDKEYIIFNIGNENTETEISKDLVISVEQAYNVALDFFATQKMSSKLKWFEL